MGGKVAFEMALKMRLDLIRPTRAQVESIHSSNRLHLTPKIDELIKRLHALNKGVFLVSGGFRLMIEVCRNAGSIVLTSLTNR